MEQRSPEWFLARLGKVTASRVADIVAKTKAGYSTSRENYAVELALQRITGNIPESYLNAAMQWGTEKEPEARAMYEMTTGNFVTEVGFIDHPNIPMSGASPDGIVGDGLIEIKCPISATHLATLRRKEADPKYICQMQWQMAVTNTVWCDFISYDPRFPEKHKLFVKRVNRDDKLIKELEDEVIKFESEIQNILKDLT